MRLTPHGTTPSSAGESKIIRMAKKHAPGMQFDRMDEARANERCASGAGAGTSLLHRSIGGNEIDVGK